MNTEANVNINIIPESLGHFSEYPWHGDPFAEPIDPSQILYVNWHCYDFTPRESCLEEVETMLSHARKMVCGSCGAIIAVASGSFSMFDTHDTGWLCPNQECTDDGPIYWDSKDSSTIIPSKDGTDFVLLRYNQWHQPELGI